MRITPNRLPSFLMLVCYTPPPMSRKGSIFYAVFFLSGATGLVYQVIWVRLMGLVYGNTSHAISIVLGAFMTELSHSEQHNGPGYD